MRRRLQRTLLGRKGIQIEETDDPTDPDVRPVEVLSGSRRKERLRPQELFQRIELVVRDGSQAVLCLPQPCGHGLDVLVVQKLQLLYRQSIPSHELRMIVQHEPAVVGDGQIDPKQQSPQVGIRHVPRHLEPAWKF
jgi:hypothetical protein